MKLFAVCLGGSAIRSNTELHDVVFAFGEEIQDTYAQLLDAWFGIPDGLHIDSWAELDVIDGYRVSLDTTPSTTPEKLFFVNLGAYIIGELNESHANEFLVSIEKKDAIKRAKERCLTGMHFVHRDYLYEVDDCLEISSVGRYFVHLTPCSEQKPFAPTSEYHLIPRALVNEYKKAHPERCRPE